MQGRGRPLHVRNVVCRWPHTGGRNSVAASALVVQRRVVAVVLHCCFRPVCPHGDGLRRRCCHRWLSDLVVPTNDTPRVCSRYSISCIAAGHGSCAWICSLMSRVFFVRRTRCCCFSHPCGRGGFREASGVVAANALRSCGAFLL